MPRFRKRPVEIEAIRYLGKGNTEGEDVGGWLWEALRTKVAEPTNGTDPFIIHTLEGDHVCSPGDWIVRGIKGELYPCKPDIFAATYEAIRALAPVPDSQQEGMTLEEVNEGLRDAANLIGESLAKATDPRGSGLRGGEDATGGGA